MICLANKTGIKTINIVRREESINILKSIGADFVFVDGDGDSLGERVSYEIGDAYVQLAMRMCSWRCVCAVGY